MNLPVPYYQDNHCIIYHGDCRDILPELEPVDLVFTSPPYWNQRTYGGKQDWVSVVPVALSNINLTNNGQILINLGLIHKDGSVFCYWDYLKDAMLAKNYRLFGWYVWEQGEGLPGDWNGRLAPSFEFIFHYNKKAIKINKWIKTQQLKIGKHGLRAKNDKLRKITTSKKYGDPFKIPNSVIRINRCCGEVLRSGPEVEHPARFPVKLPAFILKTFTSNTILDPFMGSGTTLRAAKDLNRKAIGIEIEEKYCEIAAKRLSQEVLPF